MLNSFTKMLLADGQLLLFFYVKVYTITGFRFIVTVRHPSKTYAFYLEEKEDKWCLMNKGQQPTWLQEIEVDLVQAISEQNDAITG
jgi:hypothetical protein